MDKLKLAIDPIKPGELSSLFAANGSRLKALGTVDVDFNLDGLIVPFVAIIIDNLTDACILGTDFLNMTSARIDFHNGIISFEDDLVQMPVLSTAARHDYVRVLSHTVLPARSESIIKVRVAPHFANTEIIIEPRAPIGSLKYSVAKCLVLPRGTRTICQILNCTGKPVTLARNQRIAFISKIERDDELSPMIDSNKFKIASISNEHPVSCSINLENEAPKLTKSQQEQFLADYKFDINPDLTESQKDELINLLYEYRVVFARNLEELGCYKNYEVDIETVEHRPYFIKQYRLPEVQKQAAQAEIDQMVKIGLLEPALRSKYNSPYMMVKKKNGTFRMVIDLRRGANMVCKTWNFNSKSVQEVIEGVASSNSKYFSQLDLFRGYWQLKLAPGSRDLVTITAPDQMRYRVCRMPMGLSTSASEFNRALHTALQSELHASLGLYTDDVSLYSKTFESQISKMRAVFKLLKENGLTLSPNKARLCYNDIQLLGYRISEKGIEILNDKVAGIVSMPLPANVKSLRRFMGMANYFRTHIRHFAKRTHNLRHLLKKNEPWNFTEECKAECDDIKSALISPEVLMPIKPNDDFYIEVDGSCDGMGWIVMQRDESSGNVLRPIFFGAAATNEYQRKYSSASLELQALYQAIKSLEYHFVGKRVYITTDSVTVQFLNTLHLRTNREKRIAAYLQGFDLRLVYRPGRLNTAADCLSRCFSDLGAAEKVKFQAAPDNDDDLICAITSNERTNGDNIESVSTSREERPLSNEVTKTPDENHCCNDISCNHALCRLCHKDCVDCIDEGSLDETASLQYAPEIAIDNITVLPQSNNKLENGRQSAAGRAIIQDGRRVFRVFSEVFSEAGERTLLSSNECSELTADGKRCTKTEIIGKTESPFQSSCVGKQLKVKNQLKWLDENALPLTPDDGDNANELVVRGMKTEQNNDNANRKSHPITKKIPITKRRLVRV